MRSVNINLYNVNELKEHFPSSFSKAHSDFAESELATGSWSEPIIGDIHRELSILGFVTDPRSMEWDVHRKIFLFFGIWKASLFDTDHKIITKYESVHWSMNDFVRFFPDVKEINVTQLYGSTNGDDLAPEISQAFYNIVLLIREYAVSLLSGAYVSCQLEDRFLEFCEENKCEFTWDGDLFCEE